jgi:hypothetical protein
MGATSEGLKQHVAKAREVRAVINYLPDGVWDPVWCSHDPSRTNLPVRTEVMSILDARPIRDRFSLDREGVALVNAPTCVRDFLDREAAARAHVPELEAAVKAATGARKVVMSGGWVHRHSERSGRFGEPGTTFPGRYAHVDFSDNSGPSTARQALGDDPDADRWMAGRFQVLNLWRTLSQPPQDCPLCLCDATSVAAEDLVVANIIVGPDAAREVRLETNQVRYNPGHRWVYFSDMTRDQLLMFRGYDSDPARSRRVPHTAFDDPGVGSDAPARESIDIRCVAFFG